jgi:hypothetical protein
MRTGADNSVEEDQAEHSFRNLLRSFGEPSHPGAPPDLVARSMRQLPQVPPAIALRQQSIRRALRTVAVLVFATLALLSVWIMLAGGSVVQLIGTTDAGPGRTLLVLQLMFKPLLAAFSVFGIPLLIIGVTAAILGGLLLRHYASSTTTTAHVAT